MTMADEIAVMNSGRIEQAGDATTLYEHPETAFVAKFLGVSNLIDGRASGTDAFETHDGARLNVPSSQLASRNGDALQAGVRPEKIALRGGGDEVPPGQNCLRGQVTLASFLGVSIQYLVRTPGGEELTVVEQNRGTEATHGTIGPGQDVLLTWAPEHTFVVPKEPATP